MACDQGRRPRRHLEPVRQGVKRHFEQIGVDAAGSLALRHDHGSTQISRDFLGEVKFIGIRSTPTLVGEPLGNGIAERFICAPREQWLYRQGFHDVAQAREVIGRCIEVYNTGCLPQRQGIGLRSKSECSSVVTSRSTLLTAQETGGDTGSIGFSRSVQNPHPDKKGDWWCAVGQGGSPPKPE